MPPVFDVLRHVREIIVSSHSADSAFRATLGLIKTTLGIERCNIMFHDSGEAILRLAATSETPRDERDSICLQVSEELAGMVTRTGEPLLIENIDESPVANFAAGRGSCERSFMCVPINVRGATTGAINLLCPAERGSFTSRDLKLVMAVSGILGGFLERSSLLTQSENARSQLQSIVESLHSGILTIGPDGRITMHNGRLIRLLGLSRGGDYRGTHISELLPGELLTPLLPMIEESAEFQVEKHCELELAAPLHDTVPVEISTSPLTDLRGEINGVVVTVEDVSMRREIDELRRLDEIKSNFLSMVSHELRTPLTSIKGAIHLLSTTLGGGMSEQQLALVNIVSNNADRLGRSINDLLDIVHIENQTLSLLQQPEELRPIVEASLRSFLPSAKGKGIQVEECLGNARAAVDKDRIRQVIDHLIDNAVKFTPREGTIGVSLEQSQGAVVIRVRDTGCGIDTQSQDRIFHKFYQTENPLTRSAGGLGIGLYLAKCLVELHGGRIRLEQGTGIGSEFVVELPAVPE